MLSFQGFTFALALSALTAQAADGPFDLKKLNVPAGYNISYFATDVPNARSMTIGAKGTVFVGTRQGGTVYAVTDSNGDGRADKTYVIAKGLNQPNGVAFRDGALYVAEVSRILRFDDIEQHLDKVPEPHVVYDGLPKDTHHGWKFIAFGPDGFLYVPVGAPCNICERDDKRYAALLRFKKLDGSAPEVFASGIRNTVGFTWHPATKEMWFTDNGREYLGDDVPPCELNKATKPGQHFGFPYCHGGDIADPDFGKKHACREFVAPAQKLGPHVAPLGVRFWNGRLVIAEHGSWNRSTPIGYRLSWVDVSAKGAASNYRVFIDGWRTKGELLGRPVDVQPLADGSLLVSDDQAGVIYRITANPKK